MTRKPANVPVTKFWVREGNSLVQRSAQRILREVETGQRSMESPIQVAPDRAPQPTRLFLRQLVWMADATSESGEHDSEVVVSLKREVFDSAPVGLVVSDLRGRVTEANEAIARIVRRTRTEVIGMLVGELSEAEDHARERELGNQLLFGERSYVHVEKRFLSPDGSEVPCLMGLSLLRNEHGEPRSVVGVVVDLSEQRQVEELRSRVVEADATQRLARSVAHDLANLMAVVRVSTELLEESIEDRSAEVDENLSAIVQSVELCLALNSRLRDLSLIATKATTGLSLATALRQMLPMLRKVVGADRTLLESIGRKPAWVLLSAADLETIVLNLVVNASQALSEGGSIWLELEVGPTAHQLTVRDNGRGMPPGVLARFCEP